MEKDGSVKVFVFPKWANTAAKAAVPFALGGAVYAAVLVPYALNPGTTDVGYTPQQPVEYSHELHAGQMGIDCRYCHNTVDKTAFAALPPTQTCMNCHSHILTDSEKLKPVMESYKTGKPVKWVIVHDLPDYVYFNHSAHINKGVSCVECHGRVDKMERVSQVKTLSMAWCLSCHRDPGPNLRPQEFITELDWQPPEGEQRQAQIKQLMNAHKIKSVRQLTDCSTCHR